MFKLSTPEAKNLKEALESHGIHVLSEVDDGHKHIDLAIPAAHINIEVDGIRHLTDPYQILADLSRSHYSDKLGYETLHIHNDEIHVNLPKIAKAIAEASKIRAKQLIN
jgi:very-short-patch-repair endonuclease